MVETGTLVSGLSTANEIGVMGDLHGDLAHAFRVSAVFANRGVTTLVQLGDWAAIWPRENWHAAVDKLSRRLSQGGQQMYFLDGNHDAHTILARFPIGPDGLRWITPNIAHIPRGWRTTIGGNRTLAALGGANSIDLQHRTEGVDWWSAHEQITEADLKALGPQDADVLLGHEVPFGVPSLDRHLAALPRWPFEAEWYARRSRYMFHQAVMQTRPKLTLGGHYHHFVDDTVSYTDGAGSFTCRVVVLNKNGSGISQAILDTHTLGLTFLRRNTTEAEPTPKGKPND
ncbi:hypothetical protein D9V29_09220 [Mycetocola manganoxydans]|uniref:Calcineurin-like phosphoesterase domain-containing protein n=1 Tax=Mycetocola manganoxydans TaxID=699879 RepID=A0A3L6ZV03_9MICO|nr:metallophosphoesterase [Mycetocola manganoxydans]RLP71495.1 hypothetical protein D9V29_09220 [Mycetocola manganoxydans]GHD46846.1 hypothetical protein GCM10008097_17310 [Mycetocola manganoxydans]